MRILIVDDSKMVSRKLSRTLGQFGKCDISGNGREGFEQFLLAHKEKDPYELVMLDINMPDWNGDQAIEAIRSYEKIYNTNMSRVVVLSAYLNPRLALKLFKSGTCFCLSKPWKEEELESVIKEVIHGDFDNMTYEQMIRGNEHLALDEEADEGDL